MYLGRAISIPRSFLLVEFRLGNVQPKLNYLNCIMKLLEGKRILITGISSQRSISYGIAKVCFEEGAQLTLTYNNERFKDRVQGFANDFNAGEVIKMDVTSDDSIDAAASALKEKWSEGFDGFVHSIAWAPRECIEGSFLEGISREGFLQAMNVSVYSYAALAKAFSPLLRERASIITMSYLGAEKIVPNYNTMAICKSALESVTRYIAADLGERGIRANSISCGPIKTLAASGIKDFGLLMKLAKDLSLLRSLVSTEEVGNLAAFLLSEKSFGITAETVYIDGGFNKGAGRLLKDE